MTHLDAPRPHTSTTREAARRSEHATRRTNGRPSIGLISEGVVAGYIHDIARRHHDQPSVSRRALTRAGSS
ncbi:MAG TPA: hypothetical protein VMG37_09420 [Solirubrobacteraceae bacterium]|nr:hypothetical protein [Solirubrobacteraceae bacterium]